MSLETEVLAASLATLFARVWWLLSPALATEFHALFFPWLNDLGSRVANTCLFFFLFRDVLTFRIHAGSKLFLLFSVFSLSLLFVRIANNDLVDLNTYSRTSIHTNKATQALMHAVSPFLITHHVASVGVSRDRLYTICAAVAGACLVWKWVAVFQ
jgi:hypothetical protein